MSIDTEKLSRQIIIERDLGLTKEDANLIKANPANIYVKTFMSYYAIQAELIESAGMALLECALKDVRKEMSKVAK